AEERIWRRWLDWPWYGPLQGLRLIAHPQVPWYAVEAAFDLMALLLGALCCLYLSRRRAYLPLGYVLYALAGLLLALCSPIHPLKPYVLAAKFSLPRSLLVLFPLYVAAAELASRSRWGPRLLVSLSALGCIALTFLFACGLGIA